MDFFELVFEKFAGAACNELALEMARGRSATKSNQCGDYMIGTGVVCIRLARKKLPSNSKAGFSNKEECMTRIRYWLTRKRLQWRNASAQKEDWTKFLNANYRVLLHNLLVGNYNMTRTSHAACTDTISALLHVVIWNRKYFTYFSTFSRCA